MLKRIAGSLGATSMVAVALAGCGHNVTTTAAPPVTPSTQPAASSGAPHLVVCGQLLSASAAGPIVYDIASRRYPTVTQVTVGGVIYVRVSNSCSQGAVVKITPPTAFVTIRTVRASRSGVVLVELRPALGRVAKLTAIPTSAGPSEMLRLDVAAVFPRPLVCNPRPCTVTPVPAPGAVGTQLEPGG